MTTEDSPGRAITRRRLLATGAAAGVAGLAGCTGLFRGSNESGGNGSEAVGQIGSGRSPFGDREIGGGTSMADMPEMSGELTVYSARGEVLVGELISFIEDLYPDLAVKVRYNSAAELVNQIETEGENSPAEVFFTVDASSLGELKKDGFTSELPEGVRELVREEFRDPDGQWIGTSGRARTVPYNTNKFEKSDVPTDVMAFPEKKAFADGIGWAPTYSSFQSFVTAMRVLEGEKATRQWLRGVMDLGVREYSDEFRVAEAIADGEIGVGFANHYYIQRVLAGRGGEAPIATAFTKGDAGAMFNVAGASVLKTAADAELAANFVRHLLSAEAQDYFARETFEYPLVPGVEPIGRLPTIDELNPPEGLDLTQLSDFQGTIELMRDVGVL
ncbi:iron ABC transporter substrate-binding protein [Halomarina halobia]|uniref:Iron ABC transporter substrate-binding protein n=1 Tax=Halomarina halobia TaxID=3033386 RepID=A0ABD6A630_9EURY|nr:iron ABC transporter substrate-binding protein [Halomarina sp. PSR21]